MIAPVPSGLADALFSSVQQRVLGLLFGQAGRDFSVSEVIRHVGGGTGAVHRELARLAAAGILSVEAVGNQRRYRANGESPIFHELRGLIAKTVGVVDPIRQALAPYVDAIDAAFVYGSVAKGEDRSSSDVDLMVIADDLSATDAYGALASAEASLGRRIEPTVISAAEWQRRLAEGASFFVRVRSQPKLFVVGSEHDLERLGEPREDRAAQGRAGRSRGVSRAR
jgi:predicted nucleotidyltransferase